jgi:hypothetical protein
MRDIALGWLTYFLALLAVTATITGCLELWGPPDSDRARSFAFIAGGGATFVATMILAGVGLIMFAK